MSKKFCLTCGCYENNDLKLQEEIVGVTVSRSKLEDRIHYLKDDEKILLCNDCSEELAI